jgi:hypothetical protein
MGRPYLAIDTFTIAILAILALLILGGPAPADDMPLLHVSQGGGAGHLGALAPAQFIRGEAGKGPLLQLLHPPRRRPKTNGAHASAVHGR